MVPGETASVLAVSWGKGDPHKDAITLVCVDEAGRLREHTKIDNLYDTEMVDEFVDLLKRRNPNVIVIGGFSVATLKLASLVKKTIGGPSAQPEEENGWGNPPPTTNGQTFSIPVIYVHDHVARIYQHSKRAAAEFSALSPTAKYCVGLARYTQSPLNEYAALGVDITAIAFEEDYQHLVSISAFFISFFSRFIIVLFSGSNGETSISIRANISRCYKQDWCGYQSRRRRHLLSAPPSFRLRSWPTESASPSEKNRLTGLS